MLLNDIGKPTDATFKRINQHLESNYGFKISEDVGDRDLVSIMEQIQDEITDLKIKGDDAKTSPEISKRLLVLEGIRNLREFALMQQLKSPKYDYVVNNLTDFVVDTFEISGLQMADFDRAVHTAMEEYRSSRYRFPDDRVENDVKTAAMMKIQSNAAGAKDMTSTIDPAISGAGEVAEDFPMQGKRQTAQGGAPADIPNTAQARHALKVLDKPSLSLVDEPKSDEMIPMIRDKSGRMVPDPFAAQAAARRKGIAMKEHNLDEKIESGYHDPNTGQASRPTSPEGRADLAKELKTNRDRKRDLLSPNNANRRGTSSGSTNFGVDSNYGGRDGSKPFAYSRQSEGKEMKEHATLVKNLRFLLETEVVEAEVMMAAKEFAKELQEMIEKVGRLQNEDLPPVTDQMRNIHGMESASAFQTKIYGAMQGVMDSLYTAKGQVDEAVTNMAATGDFGAQTDMDLPVDGMGDAGMGDPAAIDADAEMDADLDNLAGDIDATDEFGGAEEQEPLGRSKKMESAQLKRKVLEMKKLVEKARSLRVAKG